MNEDIARITDGRTKRASSWDRTGRNTDCIMVGPGETADLADISGAGCIRHIYFTMIQPDILDCREALLRMYWDGEGSPSVEVPLGDFFCIGDCTIRRFSSYLVAVNQGTGAPYANNGLNCYFPMPFSRGAKIQIVNQSRRTLGGVFGRLWYHIDYEEWDTPPGKDLGRFHAQWRRENPTQAVKGREKFAANLTGKDNYVMLEAEGKGHIAGLFLQVHNMQGGWYGEGDDMIFVDGEIWPPSIHGTGTEEVFGGGAGPDGEYASLYSGFVLVENRDGERYKGRNAMYRWYVHDPVRFQRTVRMTIEHGHANDFANDYASVAYWYQHEPHARFPQMPSAADRRPIFPEPFFDAHNAGAELTALFTPAWQAIFEEGDIPDHLHKVAGILAKGDEALHAGRYREAKGTYEIGMLLMQHHGG
jgi:hypothetical protein